MYDTASQDMFENSRNPTRDDDRYPIRILHVVGGMRRAGIETWLMQVLRHIDRDRFQMDFAVHVPYACDYDNEIHALGSKTIQCLYPSRPWVFAQNFQKVLREHGPYDIVHSHVHHFSGYIMRLAKQAGVRVRIAHSHNNTSKIEAQAPLYRQFYLALMKRWLDRYATVGLGASRQALPDLFGEAWETEPRWQVFYCGIDIAPFQECVAPTAVRSELGISADALTIGHVGRFEAQKNHEFIVEVAVEVAKREPKMCLLLIGDGPLRPQIERQVTQMGLGDRVIFTGTRPDVAKLMLGAMDVFLFPSLFEGLGLVAIEAQAAGIPCVFSDVIPVEANLIEPLVRRLSLSQPASRWAEAVLAAKASQMRMPQAQALSLVENSSFNVQTSVKNLEQLYARVAAPR